MRFYFISFINFYSSGEKKKIKQNPQMNNNKKNPKQLSNLCLCITYLDMGLLPLSSFAFLPSSTGFRLNRGVTSALP